jgi:putative membrane protein (TIGR04086 family)
MANKAFWEKNKGKTGQWYIIGPFYALFITAALLYICALMLSKEVIPTSVIEECAIISVFLGSAAGGVIAAKKGGEGILVEGSVTGVILFAVILIITILRPDGKVLSDETLKTAVSAIGGATFGGVMCLNRKGNRKHKKHAVHSGT